MASTQNTPDITASLLILRGTYKVFPDDILVGLANIALNRDSTTLKQCVQSAIAKVRTLETYKAPEPLMTTYNHIATALECLHNMIIASELPIHPQEQATVANDAFVTYAQEMALATRTIITYANAAPLPTTRMTTTKTSTEKK